MPQNDALEPTVFQVLKQWDAMSKYKTVSNTPELDRIVQTTAEHCEMSLDTETTGLDILSAKCLGYSFSFAPHRARWVPAKIDPQFKLLKKLVQDKHIVFANPGYDLAILEKYGIKIPISHVRDVLIACFFRDIVGYRHKAGLKAQAEMILGFPTIELKELIKANKGVKTLKDGDVDFTLLTPDQQRVYGCQDADITLQLWQDESIQKAIRSMPEIWELEHKLIEPVMEMHHTGIGIDLAKCQEFDTTLEKECAECSTQAHTLALQSCATVKDGDQTVFKNPELARLTKKKGLNLGSFKQKQLLLFDELGLPPTRKVASGYSTDQDALAIIEHEHEIVPIIMRYNRLSARRNSYTKKLPLLVNPISQRIHPSLWPSGVKSGRFSCSNPNMQGISKDHASDDPVQIRQIFVPTNGNVLTAVDYSQIELRVAASLSQEPVWCNAYNAGNVDVHSQTAAEIYGVPIDKVTSNQRDIAKTANFSILTGISAHTLSARNRKTIPTVEAAQIVIDGWFAALPVLTKWIATTKRRARTKYLMKTYFGRIRPFDEIQRPNEETIARQLNVFRERPWAIDKDPDELRKMAIRSICASFERKALSHIIQGTAADIMKIAIVMIYQAIHNEKLPVKMLLTVHDELLFEHPKSVTKRFHALLQKTITFDKIGRGWVPLTIDIGCGNNWAEAH